MDTTKKRATLAAADEIPCIKLLLVDDDAHDAARIRALLEPSRSLRFEIAHSVDLEAAMRLLKDESFHVMLLDLTLPEADGVDTVMRAKVAASSVPIIVMTSEEDEDLALRALRLGAQDYLVKSKAEARTAIRTIRHAVERHRLLAELTLARTREHYLASHDGLTGLPNRAHFYDHLQRALAYASRNDKQLAVFFVDLDRFKAINDSLGHAVGDELLQAVAERVSRSIRRSDLVGRLGGDEFAVMIQDVNRDQDPAIVARKILTALAEPYLLRGQEFWVSGSIGIAAFPRDGADPETLMRNADAAMYQAKAQGANRYCFYADHMNAIATEKLSLENSLRAAVSRKELALDFEPQIDVEQGGVVAVKARPHWRHSRRGLATAEELMSVAEETGLSVAIGEWVIRRACEEAAHWGIGVAVDVTTRQLREKGFAESVARILRETGVERGRLEIEVAEGDVVQERGITISTLVLLRRLGVRILLSDLATSFASLSGLERLPVDGFKISRPFVASIGTGDVKQTIVTALATIAQGLGLTMIAEGVENTDQVEFLRARGCDRMQGPLFGEALPAEQLTRRLSTAS